MRRLVSMLAGLALMAAMFVSGYSGSSVAISDPLATRPSVSAGGTTFEHVWRVEGVAPPALAEVAVAAAPESECRPLSPLQAPCDEAPPGMVAGALAGLDRWRPLVAKYFRSEDVSLAMAVMACESNGDPGAANPVSSARGLFQHLATMWPPRAAAAGRPGADILDPEDNVAVAAWLVYHGGGWSHWNASRGCW